MHRDWIARCLLLLALVAMGLSSKETCEERQKGCLQAFAFECGPAATPPDTCPCYADLFYCQDFVVCEAGDKDNRVSNSTCSQSCSAEECEPATQSVEPGKCNGVGLGACFESLVPLDCEADICNCIFAIIQCLDSNFCMNEEVLNVWLQECGATTMTLPPSTSCGTAPLLCRNDFLFGPDYREYVTSGSNVDLCRGVDEFSICLNDALCSPETILLEISSWCETGSCTASACVDGRVKTAIPMPQSTSSTPQSRVCDDAAKQACEAAFRANCPGVSESNLFPAACPCFEDYLECTIATGCVAGVSYSVQVQCEESCGVTKCAYDRDPNDDCDEHALAVCQANFRAQCPSLPRNTPTSQLFPTACPCVKDVIECSAATGCKLDGTVTLLELCNDECTSAQCTWNLEPDTSDAPEVRVDDDDDGGGLLVKEPPFDFTPVWVAVGATAGVVLLIVVLLFIFCVTRSSGASRSGGSSAGRSGHSTEMSSRAHSHRSRRSRYGAGAGGGGASMSRTSNRPTLSQHSSRQKVSRGVSRTTSRSQKVQTGFVPVGSTAPMSGGAGQVSTGIYDVAPPLANVSDSPPSASTTVDVNVTQVTL